MQPYTKVMLLVNRRLKSCGSVYLLPDILDIVFAHLNKLVTPRWLPKPRPNFRRRLKLATTGFFPQDLDEEFTGTFGSDLELEATGMNEFPEELDLMETEEDFFE